MMNEMATSVFLDQKAAEYVLNYARQLKGGVKEEDFFDFMKRKVGREAVEQILSEEVEGCGRAKARRLLPEIERAGFSLGENLCDVMQSLWNHRKTREGMKRALERMGKLVQGRSLPEGETDLFAERFGKLAETFQLSADEREILLARYLVASRVISSPSGGRSATRNSLVNAVFETSKWLGWETSKMRALSGEKGKLRRYRLVDNDLDYNTDLDEYLWGLSDQALGSVYYSELTDGALAWKEYPDWLRAEGEVILALVKSHRGDGPLNVLLHGAPGTGKTSFARSLAVESGRRAYGVAQGARSRGGGGGFDATPEFRYAALAVCADRVDRGESLIVVDEAERMLGADKRDKGRLNAALDGLRVPCVWVANAGPELLEGSNRRRFDYVVEFREFDGKQRLQVWKNTLKSLGMAGRLSAKDVERLSEKYPVSPGGVAMVLRDVRGVGGGRKATAELAEKLLRRHCRTMGIQMKADWMKASADYGLEGLNIRGNVKLEEILNAARMFLKDLKEGPREGLDRPRMTILLSGAPGTGKTEYAKYLSRELGVPLVKRTAGDLLSKWVGETEQNLAAAFEEARGGLLFLDEVDGLLRSREMADHRWEVTETEELLQKMEDFEGVFVAATNFVDGLDAASLRRFLFKVEFDSLDGAGKATFFRRMFKRELTEAEAARLGRIEPLAPGDFRTVRQGLYYLSRNAGNGEILDALAREADLKRGVGKGRSRLGFAG